MGTKGNETEKMDSSRKNKSRAFITTLRMATLEANAAALVAFTLQHTNKQPQNLQVLKSRNSSLKKHNSNFKRLSTPIMLHIK